MIVHALIHTIVSFLIALLALVLVVGAVALHLAAFGSAPQPWYQAADTVVQALTGSLKALLYGLVP
ncbi:hypothetical protein [Actinoalloteichus spitiensis]|uniref:hypothetical protein n=1 Tax=Actinoalloteichus spitiensis TaxID=252394 RepID=UPI0003686A1D|nr:hypothetical protein [Actinoalloteichus spitiensis]